MTKRLMAYLAPHRLRLALIIGTMLATAAAETIGPWPLKVIVDNVLGGKPLHGYQLDGSLRIVLLVAASLAYIVLAAGRGLLAFLRHRSLTAVSQQASLAMSSDLYAQVQRLSLRFHDQARVGDMVTRITRDVERLQDAFVTGVSQFSVDIVTVIGIAVVMFLVDWPFALAALMALPPLFFVLSKFRRRLRETSRTERSSEGAVASVAQEVLSSIRVVKAFGQEEREHERFMDHSRSRVQASIQSATWEGMLAFWAEVTTAAGVSIVLGYGAWRVISGHLTLGEMLVFLQYVTMLYAPVRRLTRLTNVVQKASVSAERVYELFQVAPEVPEAPHAVRLERAQGRVTFEGVWFGYDPDRPVLRGINLDIRPGEVIAVVGATGAGKSTLASLIPRFYDATRGRVLVDGIDVRDLRLRSLRDQISIVLQDPILFSGTVRDNIAYGQPGASESEVIEAARVAHAHQFIVDLDDGYNSEVGERGVTLSGGQRQRIAIARAVLRNAPILIMDEPTSAVDAESEALIMEALARLIEGRSVMVITHRVSLTQLADRVVCLTDGVIAETKAAEGLREHRVR